MSRPAARVLEDTFPEIAVRLVPGGQDIRIDGLFRQEAWRATCPLQRPRGLDVDATTSAAVQAFQRWNGISADGLVGDQTWAAPAGGTGTSLEAAVGLEHATSPHAPEPEAQVAGPGPESSGWVRYARLRVS